MRKKKQIISEKETNSFNYNGKLSISLVKNNKIIKTKLYNNNGRWPLFYFFSQCLAGNYKEALFYRPQYLVLYSAGNVGTPVPNISDSGEAISNYAKNQNRMTSGLIQVVETPIINKVEDNIGLSNLNLHFEIPFSYLKLQEAGAGSTSRWKPINLLTLYCNQYSPIAEINLSQPSTFCFIKDNDTLGDLLGELNITTDQSNYSLRIDWTLSITN